MNFKHEYPAQGNNTLTRNKRTVEVDDTSIAVIATLLLACGRSYILPEVERGIATI